MLTDETWRKVKLKALEYQMNRHDMIEFIFEQMETILPKPPIENSELYSFRELDSSSVENRPG